MITLLKGYHFINWKNRHQSGDGARICLRSLPDQFGANSCRGRGGCGQDTGLVGQRGQILKAIHRTHYVAVLQTQPLWHHNFTLPTPWFVCNLFQGDNCLYYSYYLLSISNKIFIFKILFSLVYFDHRCSKYVSKICCNYCLCFKNLLTYTTSSKCKSSVFRLYYYL